MTDFSKFVIASDLDGTFAISGKLVARNLEALERFRAGGGLFTIATGRAHLNLRSAIGEPTRLINAPAICDNGAYLYDFVQCRNLQEDLLRVEDLYEKSNLTNPSVIVDTNHNNSGKKYLEQVRIAKDIVYSRNQNADIKRLVKGLMIESYLEDGACKPEEHIFGKSITDPCLGWEKTEGLILDLADKL